MSSAARSRSSADRPSCLHQILGGLRQLAIEPIELALRLLLLRDLAIQPLELAFVALEEALLLVVHAGLLLAASSEARSCSRCC